MPSVGMRKSTRVFGLVKGVDGARVLRSGRMLWPDSGDAKLRKGNDRDDWLKSMVDSDGGVGCDRGGHRGLVSGSRDDEPQPNGEVQDMVLNKEVCLADKADSGFDERHHKLGSCSRKDGGSKMFGVVYMRKRKGKGDNGVASSRKRYGKSYCRRNKRQKRDISSGVVPQCGGGFTIVVKKGSSCASNVLCSFLCTVLKYMKTVDVRLPALIMFLMSEPLRDVFLSQGVQFSQDSGFALVAGFCKIIGSQEHCPIFSLDFSAIPACFMLMHCQMLLRCLFVPQAFLHISATGQTVCSSVVEIDLEDCEDMECCPAGESNTPKVDIPMSVLVSRLPVNSLKMETRYSQRRCGTARCIQRRRSSLRTRRGKNNSFSGMSKCNGSLASDLVCAKKNGFPFSSVVSGKKNRGSMRTRSAGNLDEISSKVQSLQHPEPIICTANFLTSRSEQCIREEGVNIVLESSNSGEYSLVGRKDGFTRFMYKALEAMKPCVANRFCHPAVWNGDNGWNLEFPDHDDWLKFKDLHKECVERNKQTVSPRSGFPKIIPVPQVCEVLGYEEDHYATFLRPSSYIVSTGDELSRAMTSTGSSYDMDSEDEEWLKVYNMSNVERLQEDKLIERVSDESFEHMIDAFEKDFYCNPHDLSDEKPASHICTEMANKDVLEAVYGYWTRKRKQRRSVLVRVFQGYQPRKAPLIPKPVFRKKRSFKRQASQQGRGMLPAFLQATVVAERDPTEEQAAMHKFEEAREIANRSTELAINKRQRAQFLTENADLAAYRAAMALRIAEAAQVTESPDIAASHFLD
ncbi:hypothetical protein MLD38_038047 [Melastoma candidum]|uniref:Uncharacterized protein n=1 Tax=Melastoma candidum TaxID=119954 RepID=A0ACB9KYT5_9MYRT|nr:hypothetical protein MLD38_038047 [Melastoma candidum]